MEISEEAKKIAEKEGLPIKPPRETPREEVYPKPEKDIDVQPYLRRTAKEVCGVCGKIIYENDYSQLVSPCDNPYCPYFDSPIPHTRVTL